MDKHLLEEYSKTLSTHKIAARLGVSQTNVRYWIKKYGFKTPKQKDTPVKEPDTYICLNCGSTKVKTYSNFGKYCDSSCKNKHYAKEYISKWEQGLIPGNTSYNEVSRYIRNYLLDKYNNSCQECGWNKLHPVDNLPRVEVDHIDGDSSNCRPDNLRVLCPNCHSMTPTYGTRNKSSSRAKKMRCFQDSATTL